MNEKIYMGRYILVFFTLMPISLTAAEIDLSGINMDKEKQEVKSVNSGSSLLGEVISKKLESALSGGSSDNFVLVKVECVSALCSASNLKISGGLGQFESDYNGSSSGGIHKGYRGVLAGRYNWSAKVGDSYCSGNFNLSGTESAYTLNIFPDGCKDGGSGEYW